PRPRPGRARSGRPPRGSRPRRGRRAGPPSAAPHTCPSASGRRRRSRPRAAEPWLPAFEHRLPLLDKRGHALAEVLAAGLDLLDVGLELERILEAGALG